MWIVMFDLHLGASTNKRIFHHFPLNLTSKSNAIYWRRLCLNYQPQDKEMPQEKSRESYKSKQIDNQTKHLVLHENLLKKY